MTVLRVHGIEVQSTPPSPLEQRGQPGRVHVKRHIRLQQTRAAGGFEDVELVTGEILELELADGLWLWVRAEDALADLKLTQTRGDGPIELPPELQLRPSGRGLGEFVIKALRLLHLDIPQAVGEFVKTQVEDRAIPGHGLYQCDRRDVNRLTPVQPLNAAAAGPTLVLLHGTASSTQGSFGALWASPTAAHSNMERLFSAYGGRVLAFQHRSLSQSPIENAVELMKALEVALPKNAEIHLLSHSRGGLIGELLARSMRHGAAPFTQEDLALFDDDAARPEDRAGLGKLNELFTSQSYRITRFMRVACPARGTLLADRRLDRYFSVLVNLLRLSGLGANPLFEGFTSLLAAVLKLRTQPEELPGLEAMMPTSRLIALLNRADVVTRADLRVLGGDLEGSGGVWNRLQTLATDCYYREDHDLVVHTQSMLGGTARAERVRYWIDTGPDVTHFKYFEREDTAQRVVLGLTGTTEQVDGVFHDLLVETTAAHTGDYRKRASSSSGPSVFVIPGIMGSTLSTGGRDVWMDLWLLANEGLQRLEIDAPNVSATGVMRSGYHRLCEHLSASHDVVVFPYDWRRSLRESAQQLQRALQAKLEASPGQPVRIVAHSMGGLVVRAMLTTPEGRKTWQCLSERAGARCVMLGTPSAGSHAIPAMLMGRDSLVKKLALLDLRHNYAQLLKTLARFDGVLQLLPLAKDNGLDFFEPSTWERLAALDLADARGLFGSPGGSNRSAGVMWTLPERARLATARQLLDSMQTVVLDPERCIYVAGTAEATPCDVQVDENAKEGLRVKVVATAHGDGRVTWATGIPKNLPTYYMDVVHGDMADEPEHFEALVDLLSIGRTSKLPTQPERRRAAADQRFELETPLSPTLFPDLEDLTRDALGGKPARRRTAATAERIKVQVIQDDLSNATAPVVVGHYAGDMLVGPEAQLDQCLDGRLSEISRMGLYPGAVGRSIAVLNDISTERPDNGPHPGAIVVGLGEIGELTPGGLTNTLTEALTSYGAECVARERRRRQRENVTKTTLSSRVSAPVAALLVGSGGGVTLADSVQCLLQAVTLANQRLDPRSTRGGASALTHAGSKDNLFAFIDCVDLYEMYEERAVEAVHVLRDFARCSTAHNFSLQELLVHRLAGLRSVRSNSDLAWWQRLRITVTSDGGLSFEALTQRARSASSTRQHYLAFADAFVNAAISRASHDPSIGYTLFELLVPPDFKLAARDRRNLALVLDSRSAALPWELLQDKYDRGARPVSVETAMIRQLRSDDYAAPLSTPLRALDQTALVIGNPFTGDPRFPSLPEAESEALVVSELLRSAGFHTTPLTGESATAFTVLSALHERPWKILHLAAHGVFELEVEQPEPKQKTKEAAVGGGRQGNKVTGLVMSHGLFFTAEEAAQMRAMPDLVFINCCHLGNTEREEPYHRIAANLATQFIAAGARVVVAAGWAVNDAAAKTFATELYGGLLAGARFGEAVKHARSEVYARHGQTNTWGAYQCYGDTEYSLRISGATPLVTSPVAPVEVELRAKLLAQQAKHGSTAQREALVAELSDTVARLPPAFLESASMHEALGCAFGELGQLKQASEHYRQAIQHSSGSASLRCIEQWANLTARCADAAGSELIATFEEVELNLNALIAIRPSCERYAILGSLYKSWARAVSGEDRKTRLGNMREAYAKALDSAQDANPSDKAYALANRIAATLVVSWSAEPDPQLPNDLAELDKLATTLEGSSTAYFDLAQRAEHLLLSSLANGALDEANIEQIARRYERATSRGVPERQLSSTLRQLRLLKDFASSELKGSAATAMAEFLDKLYARMEKPR